MKRLLALLLLPALSLAQVQPPAGAGLTNIISPNGTINVTTQSTGVLGVDVLSVDVSQLTQTGPTDVICLCLLPPPGSSYPTASKTLLSSDNNSVIAVDLTTATTYTLPVAGNGIAAGFVAVIENQNTGLVTINAGAGATINTGSANSGTQYAAQNMTAYLLLDPTGANWIVSTGGGFSATSGGIPVFPGAVQANRFSPQALSCGVGSSVALYSTAGLDFCTSSGSSVTIDNSGNMNFAASGNLSMNGGNVTLAATGGAFLVPQNTGTVTVPTSAGLYNNGIIGSMDLATNGASAIHIGATQVLTLSSLTTAGAVITSAGGVISSSGAPTLAVTNFTGSGTFTASSAGNLTGTTVGSIPYQSASGTTSYLSNVAVGSILAAAGVTTAPAYTNTPTLSGFATGATALTITAPNSFTGTALLINTGTSPSSTLLNIEANGTTEFSVGSAGAATAVKYVLTGGSCLSSTTSIINPSSTNFAICSGATTDATFTASNQTFNGSTIDMPSIASSSAATTGTVCWTTSTGNLTVDTTLACLSSTIRVKQAVQSLFSGLWTAMRLRPVSYELKPEYNPKHLGRQVGLIAEDVIKVDPRLVGMTPDGKQPLGVRYMQLTAVLVSAIQGLVLLFVLMLGGFGWLAYWQHKQIKVLRA